MPAIGAAAWLGGIAAQQAGLGAYALLVAAAAVVVLLRGRHRMVSRLPLAMVLIATAAVTGTVLRHTGVSQSPIRDLAASRATADVVATVTSDPRLVEGRDGPQAVVHLRVHEVTARGHRIGLGAAVVVIGDPAWSRALLGERVRARGRLAPSDDAATAALLTGARPPVRIRGPDPWWRASATVRASIRTAVAHRPADQAGLVPALVDGDDAGLDAGLEEDFRTTGLTHLNTPRDTGRLSPWNPQLATHESRTTGRVGR